MLPQEAVFDMWDAFLISWILAAFWSERSIRQTALWSQLVNWAVLLLGLVLLLGVFGDERSGPPPYWMLDDRQGWVLVALAGLGFLICWWARIHLGRLWAVHVGRTMDHRIVDSGPYAFVRHPINMSLMTAALATAVLRGTPVALIGAALMTLGLLIQTYREERFLRQEFGDDVYGAYADRVPMLLPISVRRRRCASSA